MLEVSEGESRISYLRNMHYVHDTMVSTIVIDTPMPFTVQICACSVFDPLWCPGKLIAMHVT